MDFCFWNRNYKPRLLMVPDVGTVVRKRDNTIKAEKATPPLPFGRRFDHSHTGFENEPARTREDEIGRGLLRYFDEKPFVVTLTPQPLRAARGRSK